MTSHLDAIKDAVQVTRQLIVRGELSLADSILDQCFLHAKALDSKEVMFDCRLLKMHCNINDDSTIDEIRHSITTYYKSFFDLEDSHKDKIHLEEIYKTKSQNASITDKKRRIYEIKASLYTRLNNTRREEAKFPAIYHTNAMNSLPRSTKSWETNELHENAEKIHALLANSSFLKNQSHYEISACVKNMTNDTDGALECCNKAIEIKPDSAYCLNLKLELLKKKIQFYLQNDDDDKLIYFIEDYLSIQSSAELCFKMAAAYLRKSDYEFALDAFRNAKATNKDYKPEEVSLSIIYCLFLLANTKRNPTKQFRQCMRKLQSFSQTYPDSTSNEMFTTMIDYFKSIDLWTDTPEAPQQDPATPRKKLKTLESTAQSIEVIPEEIKKKTREALAKMSFMADRTWMPERDQAAEFKIDPEHVYPIGDPVKNTHMYIPQAHIDQDRRAHYVEASKHPVLASDSQGGIGPKILSDKKHWELKIREKYRLISTATLTFFDTPKTTEDGKPVSLVKRVIIMDKEKAHNQVGKAVR